MVNYWRIALGKYAVCENDGQYVIPKVGTKAHEAVRDIEKDLRNDPAGAAAIARKLGMELDSTKKPKRPKKKASDKVVPAKDIVEAIVGRKPMGKLFPADTPARAKKATDKGTMSPESMLMLRKLLSPVVWDRMMKKGKNFDLSDPVGPVHLFGSPEFGSQDPVSAMESRKYFKERTRQKEMDRMDDMLYEIKHGKKRDTPMHWLDYAQKEIKRVYGDGNKLAGLGLLLAGEVAGNSKTGRYSKTRRPAIM